VILSEVYVPKELHFFPFFPDPLYVYGSYSRLRLQAGVATSVAEFVMPAMPKAKYEAACVHVIAWHYPAS
jgi:hypothetical protein